MSNNPYTHNNYWAVTHVGAPSRRFVGSAWYMNMDLSKDADFTNPTTEVAGIANYGTKQAKLYWQDQYWDITQTVVRAFMRIAQKKVGAVRISVEVRCPEFQ